MSSSENRGGWGFFIKGLVYVALNLFEGKEAASDRDVFTKDVIGVRRTERKSFSSVVGVGLRSQDC